MLTLFGKSWVGWEMGVIWEIIDSLKILYVFCEFRFYILDFFKVKFLCIVLNFLYLGKIIIIFFWYKVFYFIISKYI